MIANLIKFLPFAWIGGVIVDANFGFEHFYESLSTGLTMILITIIWQYVKYTKDMFSKLAEGLDKLNVSDSVQENKIHVLDKRVESLEENQKLVKYKSRN